MKKLILALLFCSLAFGQSYRTGKQKINVSPRNPNPVIALPIAGTGYRTIPIIGHNTDLDTAATEELWESGGVLTYLSSAETMNLVSTDVKDTDFAVGVLTLSTNIADTKTVTIGSKVYTFQDTLTDTDGNVQIGTLATNTIDNLIAAITLTGTPGTDYAASMTEHPNVTASAGGGDSMDAVSEIGNNEAITDENDDNASWANTTLINGVGLRSVRIEGINNSYAEISEVVSLDGTTNSLTTLAFLRVNHITGQRVGSENDNAGVVTATSSSASTIQSSIDTSDGLSHNFHYTVPAGKLAYIINTEVALLTVAASTVVLFELKIREPGNTWHTIFEKNLDKAIKVRTSEALPIVKAIQPKTDIVMQVTTSINDAEVFATCQLLLINQ